MTDRSAENRFHALKFAVMHNVEEGGSCYDVVEAARAFAHFLDGTTPKEEVTDDVELADLKESYPKEDWLSQQPDISPIEDELFDAPVAVADSPYTPEDVVPTETPFSLSAFITPTHYAGWASETLDPPSLTVQGATAATIRDAINAGPADEPPTAGEMRVYVDALEAEATFEHVASAVEAIASSPPPSPDASEDDEMTDEQVERTEERLSDPRAQSADNVFIAGISQATGQLADASQSARPSTAKDVASAYVNTVTRTKWPWMP